MKIVQSLWSKPGQKREGFSILDINKCSWPDKKFNYFSWALSFMQFRSFYDRVELVTDEAGYDLLINKLQLPYTDVKVVLDDLNHYHADIWAIGKLYAYSIQEEPFIHADGDVYIWRRFSDELESSALLCQRKEEGKHYNNTYSEIFLEMMRHFNYYPEVLDRSISRNDGIKAINAGIIGGHDIGFFKMYTKKAFEFIDRNIDQLDKINIKTANIVFEQFLFCALCEDTGAALQFYNPDANDMINDYADYTGIPVKSKYIHTPGAFKQNKYLADSLEYRLLTDYPEHYYRIINLLKTNQI